MELFEEAIPIAIEFWSFRCEACRNVTPVVSQMAETFHTRLKVFKVNTDANPSIVSHFAIPLVPYLLILKDGLPIASFAEEWNLEQIQTLLEKEALN